MKPKDKDSYNPRWGAVPSKERGRRSSPRTPDGRFGKVDRPSERFDWDKAIALFRKTMTELYADES